MICDDCMHYYYDCDGVHDKNRPCRDSVYDTTFDYKFDKALMEEEKNGKTEDKKESV